MVDRLELATVDGHDGFAEQIQVPAQGDELATYPADGLAVVLAKVGDGLEIWGKALGQPHQLEIALTFPFKLQREYRVLRKQYWGQRMWARGYFACSTGNVTDEMIVEYIRSHSETEDQFKIVDAGDFESH